jgi:hypothetical protein
LHPPSADKSEIKAALRFPNLYGYLASLISSSGFRTPLYRSGVNPEDIEEEIDAVRNLRTICRQSPGQEPGYNYVSGSKSDCVYLPPNFDPNEFDPSVAVSPSPIDLLETCCCDFRWVIGDGVEPFLGFLGAIREEVQDFQDGEYFFLTTSTNAHSGQKCSNLVQLNNHLENGVFEIIWTDGAIGGSAGMGFRVSTERFSILPDRAVAKSAWEVVSYDGAVGYPSEEAAKTDVGGTEIIFHIPFDDVTVAPT